MTDPGQVDALMMSLVGAAVVAAVLINALSGRLGVPALVGFLLLGVLLRLADSHWQFLSEPVMTAFRFMANLGVVALLFKVGLESHPRALAAKLPSASLIWIGGGFVSAAMGFFCQPLLAVFGAGPLTGDRRRPDRHQCGCVGGGLGGKGCARFGQGCPAGGCGGTG